MVGWRYTDKVRHIDPYGMNNAATERATSFIHTTHSFHGGDSIQYQIQLPESSVIREISLWSLPDRTLC